MKNLVVALATLFGLGRIGGFPGTLGSAVGVLLIYLCGFSDVVILVLFLFLLPIGVVCSHLYGIMFFKHDAKEVIIDEVLGMLALFLLSVSCTDGLIALLSRHDLGLWLSRGIIIVCYFVLFRFFDIIKPFPICWVDRKIKGGIGVVLDDLLAAFAAFLVVRIVYYFLV